MRRWLAGLLFLVSVSMFGSQNEYRIAILDFEIMTTRDDFRFVGKGLAEIISFELSDENALIVIDRSKRNAALEEINFSLSGLSDEKASLDVGRLLTANYMVFGEIIEMDRKFLVTMKLLDVETGAIVWQEQLLTRLNNYESVSRYFAESLMAAILPDEPQVIETPAVDEAVADDGKEEFLIAFSAAVDALDEGKEDVARQELHRARAIDSGSRVVRYYLNLLTVVSPKFNFELRPWGSVYNPAYLPKYTMDKVYLWLSLSMNIGESYQYTVSPEITTKESAQTFRLGYLLPIGERHGLEVALVWSQSLQNTGTTIDYDFLGISDDYFNQTIDNYSLVLGYGYSVTPTFSLGLTFQPIILDWGDSARPFPTSFQFTVSAGGLFTMLDGRLLWDFQTTYGLHPQYYIIESDQAYYEGQMPLIIDTSIIGAAVPDRLYFSLKSNVDVYLDDRGGYYLRIIPMAEYWIGRTIAVRAGYLMSHLNQLDASLFGHGVTAGITAKPGKWELDIAYSYSQKPITNVPGYLIPDHRLLVGISRNGNFIGK